MNEINLKELMNKYEYMKLAVLGIAGFIFYGGYSDDYSAIIGFSILIYALIGWFNHVANKKEEELNAMFEIEEYEVFDEDMFEGEVFHNDFSKVPAGDPDGEQSFYSNREGKRPILEDVEQVTVENKKIKKKNNLDV